ncbi:alkaline phosphatase family protein [Arthrobacter roseus]
MVLVDGLGKALLRQHGSHAPFLRSTLSNSRTLSAAVPTTTAASLGSFGTGLAPGIHGMTGYDVLDPDQDKVVNLLGGWDANVDPERWQPHDTVLERAASHVRVTTVSLPRFAESAMTRACLRGGEFSPASGVHARVSVALEALRRPGPALVYQYWNELDKAGHRYGCQSVQWLEQLEEIDSAMRRLAAKLPPDTLLLLTADHGMVDIAPEQRFDYSLDASLIDGVRHTAGEPRMVQLFTEPGLDANGMSLLLDAWRQAYGSRAWIISRQEAIASGYFGDVLDSVHGRIGDILIAAREPIALFDGRRVADSAMSVVGQHGSLTRAEREVPLLTLHRPG